MRKKLFTLHNQMLDGFTATLKQATYSQLKYALRMCDQLPSGPSARFMGDHKELFRAFIWAELKRRSLEDRFNLSGHILKKFKFAAKNKKQD